MDGMRLAALLATAVVCYAAVQAALLLRHVTAAATAEADLDRHSTAPDGQHRGSADNRDGAAPSGRGAEGPTAPEAHDVGDGPGGRGGSDGRGGAHAPGLERE